MTFTDGALLLLNGITVGIFVAKALLVGRALHRHDANVADLHDMVIAIVLLLGAVSLAIVSLTVRFAPAGTVDVLRIVIAFMRPVLLIPGIWLLLYWRKR